jgi:hypothetical protein
MRHVRSSTVALAVLLLGALAPRPVAAGSPLVELRVYPDGASIYLGGVFGMGAVGIYADGSTRDLSAKARFESDDLMVAEFVKKNFLKGLTSGVTHISASYKGVESAPVSFTVSPISGLAIIPAEDGLRLGTTLFWGATATLVNGADGFPFTRFVTWASDDASVLPTETEKKGRGVSVGAALGTANLSATFDRTSGPDLVVTRPITVVQTLSSVAVRPAARVIQEGDGARFRAIGTFEGGVLADISFDVDWSSLDEDVVSPSSKGTLKVRGFGTTTLRVVDRATLISSETSGGDATLTIVGEVESLTVEPASLALPIGEDERFDAIAAVEGSTETFSWGGRVVWTSSDPAIASVNADGDVLCVGAGTATISARDRRSAVTSTDAEITCS